MGGRLEDSQAEKQAVRVLVVDGRPRQAAAVRDALKAARPPFVVSPARRLWSAVQIVAGIPIDAVLLDLELPDSEGLSALHELREQAPEVPVIILGEESRLVQSALDEGADDCVPRDDLDPNRLGVRILEAIKRRKPAAPDPPVTELEAPTGDVLIVEDDPWIQRLLRRNLEGQGHQVVAMSTPSQALQWAQQGEPWIDMLVCDVELPGMEGSRLSRHLQKQFPELVTLLLCSDRGAVDADLLSTARFAYLARPYSLDDFADVVTEIIAQGDATTGS